MKVAVVGHVEWSSFAKVDHIPSPGEIIKSSEYWSEPAGGGGVACVQLLELAGSCLLFTAVGNDENGHNLIAQLSRLGVEVYASIIDGQQTQKSFIHINKDKERSITVMGDLEPSGSDSSLPWAKLAEMDAVYFISGDGIALLAARQAKYLISTSRTLPILKETLVELDALVMSQKDSDESYQTGDLKPAPKIVVRTEGKDGCTTDSGERCEAEIVSFEELKDTYGCGDSFAAGLTYGIAQGSGINEVLKLATHSGAMAAKRSGAHGTG